MHVIVALAAGYCYCNHVSNWKPSGTLFRRLTRVALVGWWCVAMGAVVPSAQQPGPGRGGDPGQVTTGPGRGRPVPPQPAQAQGLEYLVGKWTFSWVGRESPVTPGPRSGTTTVARSGPNLAQLRTEGKVDDTGASYVETGTAEWNAAARSLVLTEHLAGGAVVSGVGDWSSPLAIRYESEPVKVGTTSVRVRRTYRILSAQSFSVAEELSIDGGAYQRLGNGLYTKQ